MASQPPPTVQGTGQGAAQGPVVQPGQQVQRPSLLSSISPGLTVAGAKRAAGKGWQGFRWVARATSDPAHPARDANFRYSVSVLMGALAFVVFALHTLFTGGGVGGIGFDLLAAGVIGLVLARLARGHQSQPGASPLFDPAAPEPEAPWLAHRRSRFQVTLALTGAAYITLLVFSLAHIGFSLMALWGPAVLVTLVLVPGLIWTAVGRK